MKHSWFVAKSTHDIASTSGIPSRVAATGFVPKSDTLHRTYNLVLSLALFVLVLPLFGAIALALLVTQGRSIFYYGPRLGRDRKLFHVIKFRTLDGEKARALTKDGVLPPGSGIETPLGGFLRDTRLDELPQLLNVIAGDMNLCGPRPVRPEIAAIYRCEVPNYDDRFAVKPGLVGHTQAYMNHGASKAVRARYNAILVRSPVRYVNEFSMVALVGLCVLARGHSAAWRALGRKVMGEGRENDAERRARFFDARFIADGETVGTPVAAVDDATIVLRDRAPLGTDAVCGRLELRLPDGSLRWARVSLDAIEGRGGATVFRYRPLSDFAHHVLTRYLLMKVVVPHKSHLPIVRAMNLVGGGFRRTQPTVHEKAHLA